MTDNKKDAKRYAAIPPQREALVAEAEVLRHWDENNIFKRSIDERPEEKSFVFFEGPPTANGRPGVHHAMARTIKDLVCRYEIYANISNIIKI